MKRTIGITIFGYSIILMSVLSLISFLQITMLHRGFLLYYSLIYFLALLITGIGILLVKNWARILLFFVVFIKIVDTPFRAIPYILKAHTRIIGIVDIAVVLVIGVFIFWFFNRKSIKAQFQEDRGVKRDGSI